MLPKVDLSVMMVEETGSLHHALRKREGGRDLLASGTRRSRGPVGSNRFFWPESALFNQSSPLPGPHALAGNLLPIWQMVGTSRTHRQLDDLLTETLVVMSLANFLYRKKADGA